MIRLSLPVLLTCNILGYGFVLRPNSHVSPRSEVASGDSSDRLFSSNNYGEDDQAVEALQSLVDFHEGNWIGTARSFSVTADIAAGIVQRKVSPEYQISVKLGLDPANRDFTLTETLSWDDKLSSRSMSLTECQADVDSVDASYSLDSTLPTFPSDIVGTDQLCQFVVEHCIVASEDRRLRCLVLYAVDQSLQRIVVCDEHRSKATSKPPPSAMGAIDEGGSSNQLTARDLLEMQSDVDRLVDKLTGNMPASSSPSSSSNTEDDPAETTTPPLDDSSILNKLGQSMASDEGSQTLSPHDISLLEVSSGVWLGDAIIRDNPMVPGSTNDRGMGFGAKQSSLPLSTKKVFANWSVGVQKTAWRYMWNFGEEIRQVVDIGKAMGAQLSESLSKSISGSVCVNESLSRRMVKEDRMVYIDWAGERVGFLVGPVAIQVPRYLTFDPKTRTTKPFYTEFSLFQGTEVDASSTTITIEGDDKAAMNFPELRCSKISRAYNFEGQLKQGCTSFYSFKRFGVDDTE